MNKTLSWASSQRYLFREIEVLTNNIDIDDSKSSYKCYHNDNFKEAALLGQSTREEHVLICPFLSGIFIHFQW